MRKLDWFVQHKLRPLVLDHPKLHKFARGAYHSVYRRTALHPEERLKRQVAKFGASWKGQDRPQLLFDEDGAWLIIDGVKLAFDPQFPDGGIGSASVSPEERAVADALSLAVATVSAAKRKGKGTGPTVLDIGAHIGLHALLLAKCYPHARIHAFEPVPVIASTLERNVHANKAAATIQVHRIGIADTDGSMTMTGGEFAGNHFAKASGADMISVPVQTLDSFVKKHGVRAVDVIKCDVEGAELAVLRGAGDTLRKHRPIVIIEIVEDLAKAQGASARDAFAFLFLLGYAIRPALGTQWYRSLKELPVPAAGENFVCVQPKLVRALSP